jgi:hypothetical protein
VFFGLSWLLEQALRKAKKEEQKAAKMAKASQKAVQEDEPGQPA